MHKQLTQMYQHIGPEQHFCSKGRHHSWTDISLYLSRTVETCNHLQLADINNKKPSCC